MKTRADFLRAQRGRRFNSAALGVEICATPEQFAQPDRIRVGFTASVKVGNAVARNRAKRRLRAAAAAILPLSGQAGHDYVLIARTATVSRPFAALLDDLSKAVEVLNRPETNKTADSTARRKTRRKDKNG